MSKNKGLINDGWSDNFIRKLKKNQKLLRDLWNPLAMEKLKGIRDPYFTYVAAAMKD